MWRPWPKWRSNARIDPKGTLLSKRAGGFLFGNMGGMFVIPARVHDERANLPNPAWTWTVPWARQSSSVAQRFLRAFALTLASVSAATAIGWLLRSRLELEDIVLLYLIGAIVVASRCAVAESVLSAVAHACAFDYIFLPPPFALALPDPKRTITLVAMGVVAAALASSQQRLRNLEQTASFRAHAASTMYRLVRELGATRAMEQIAHVTCRNIERLAGGHAQVVDAGPNGPEIASARLNGEDQAAVRSAWSSVESVVRPAASGSPLLAAPIVAARAVVGVVLLRNARCDHGIERELVSLVEQCAQQAGAAIERGRLEQEMQRALTAIEAEQMHNSLIGAASQDFRTPIAVIKAAGEAILSQDPSLSSQNVQGLAGSIVRESDRLMLIVCNLLNLLRVEVGTISLQRTEIGIEDLISVALRRLDSETSERRILSHIPDDVPLVNVDAVLMELVLTNIFDNAFKYAPPGTPVELSLRRDSDLVVLEISDHGPGLQHGEELRVFEKFVRGSAATRSDGGIGIGLTTSRGIVAAHGGSLGLSNRPDGPGAVAVLRVPAAPQRPLAEDRAGPWLGARSVPS